MKNNRGFLKILASLLMGMFFLFSNGASASTLQVDLDHILSPDADGFYQICWLGRTDSETLPLRQKMQAYLELQLERAGLRLRFFEDCLTAPRPMFPVGIGFFDAIDNPEGIKNTLLGTTQLNPYPGHPTTYHMGD